MSSTSEQWLQFHPNNNNSNINNNNNPALGHVASSYAAATSPPDMFFSGLVSEATAVSTAAAPDPAQLGPAGRVTKPVRRRTRASRRTPTTLINTDTSNFRAMVQQFTGGPGNAFPSIGGVGPQGFGVEAGGGLGLGYGMQYGGDGSSNHNNVHANMFMQSNMNMNMNTNMGMIDNDYNTYVGNTGNNHNNNNAKGGSSSSENRSGNNFQF